VTAAPIRALVVEDDALARERLCSLVRTSGQLAIAGVCGDGRQAVDALAAGGVDLMFLDVEMPRLDGFGVIAEVGAERMPPVIFTSAFSEYAVRAFEAYALDYLLKPFDDERFAAAVERAVGEVEARRIAAGAGVSAAGGASGAGAAPGNPRLAGLLEHLRNEGRPLYPEAIAIRAGEQYVVLKVQDIDWIEADGNYAKVYVQQRPRLLTKTLAKLEQEVLDPRAFVRVHRSAIVNVSRIAAVEPLSHGELSLVLKDGTRVPCSRRHRKDLEERLYFTA
jgi:two-component system LytT family response regulator